MNPGAEEAGEPKRKEWWAREFPRIFWYFHFRYKLKYLSFEDVVALPTISKFGLEV